MRRGLVASACVGVMAFVCALLFGASVMGPYLAAWLVFLSLPVGALPLVLAFELAGQGGSAGNGYLRWMLMLMPAAALTGLPVLLSVHALYPWAGQMQHGFAATWFTPVWFAVRGVVYLVVWTGLCLACLRPPEAAPRVALCVAGLAAHLVIGTLAATDWVASLSPGLGSASFGLLLISVQVGIALSAALLLARLPPHRAPVLLALVTGVWVLLHATQYLIVWSADKPTEITWYLARQNLLGQAAVWLGVAGFLGCLGSLGLAATRTRVTAVAGLLLAAHVVETFWLVTPSIRHSFMVSPADILAFATLGLAAWAMVWAWRPARVQA